MIHSYFSKECQCKGRCNYKVNTDTYSKTVGILTSPNLTKPNITEPNRTEPNLTKPNQT